MSALWSPDWEPYGRSESPIAAKNAPHRLLIGCHTGKVGLAMGSASRRHRRAPSPAVRDGRPDDTLWTAVSRRELGGDICKPRAALYTWERLCHELIEQTASRAAEVRHRLDAEARDEHRRYGGATRFKAMRADRWECVRVDLVSPVAVTLEHEYGDFPNRVWAKIEFGLSDRWSIVVSVNLNAYGEGEGCLMPPRISLDPVEAASNARFAATRAIDLIWPFCDPYVLK